MPILSQFNEHYEKQGNLISTVEVNKRPKNSNFVMLSNKSVVLVKVETTNLYLREEEHMEYIYSRTLS